MFGGDVIQRAEGGEDHYQQGAVEDLPDRDRRDNHQQTNVKGLVTQRFCTDHADPQPPVR